MALARIAGCECDQTDLNLLRAELMRLWRLEAACADDDIEYAPVRADGELQDTKGNAWLI